MTRANVFLTMLVATLIVSGTLVLVRNSELRTQLGIANKVITSLQAGDLHEDVTSAAIKQTVSLTILKASDPIQKTLPGIQPDLLSRPCNTCSLKTMPDTAPSGQAQNSIELTSTASLLSLKSTQGLGRSDARFTLFIFFSPTDCPPCLSEARVWQKLFQEGALLNLDIIGVVDRASAAEGADMLRQLGVSFPTVLDANSSLRSSFKIGTTPEKILVDASGKVLMTSSGDPTADQQRSFEEEVRKICGV